MSSIIAALAVVSVCSWDNPGANPYRGPVAASVHHYTDIPLDVRNSLQRRMEKRHYDEIAEIKRDTIRGEHEYQELRDMHFGGGKICRQVSRTKWKDGAVERGLVYCEQGHCIIVPTVCNNVSRVTRIKTMTSAPGSPSGPVEPLAAALFFPSNVPLVGGTPVVMPAPPGPSFSGRSIPPPPTFSWSDRHFPTPVYGGLDVRYLPPASPPIDDRGVPLPEPEPVPIIPPQVVIIPEPSTWALILAGFALVVYWSRRSVKT